MCLHGGTYRSHIYKAYIKKHSGLGEYVFHPVWGQCIRRTVCSETNPNPMCPRNTAAQTHTPTRAPWQIITPTASREQNAHVGPITTLDKGRGTPNTLLLCLPPELCVCFAWLNELYLQIFKAFCSLCIVSMLENGNQSNNSEIFKRKGCPS